MQELCVFIFTNSNPPVSTTEHTKSFINSIKKWKLYSASDVPVLGLNKAHY